ncbi:MAG: right-handed parallel beta-helix repeat-containing protein [Candidatus Krumholzibacteriota bacterium]
MTMDKGKALRAMMLLLVVAGSVLWADTAEARRRTVRGTVYEDILGDGSLVGDFKTSGLGVRLYRDGNNNGLVDAGDTFLEEHTTNASGAFNFKVETNATGDYYLVAVNSRGMSPSAGFNGGFGPANVWAQQTVGDDPTTIALDVGPRFGGATPGVSDGFNTGSTNPADNIYQHVGRADVSGPHADNIDFGFSFTVVTNPLGGGSTAVQGSLRQFLVNANAMVGDNVMRFVPAVAPNASGGGGQWWRLSLTANLPALTDPGTTVDGVAFDAANGVAILDANPGVLGTGGGVGTSGAAVATVARPELEIAGSNGTLFGLRIQADLTTVRNLSVHSFSSFGWSAAMGNILVETCAGTIIEQNVLGTGPGGFTDPGAWRSVPVITLAGATGGTLHGNLIAFSDRHGVEARAGTDGWLIEGNEIFANAQSDGAQNGLSLDGCSNVTVTGNLIHENGGAGVDVEAGSAAITLLDNTIRRNGMAAIGGTETPGVRVVSGGLLVQGNVLAENYGAGVMVVPAANAVTITRNSIYGNGTITNTGGWAPTGQVGIDLLAGGENDRSGVAPYYTLNDNGDGDAGGNDLLNFPVLESALNVGGELTLSGWARPGSMIEMFIAAADPSGLGEGETYVTTLTEGSALDLDGTTSLYGPLPVNGVPVGQDNTNRFQFVIPLPAGVVTGDLLTMTATMGGSTSEFGGVTAVTALVPNILVSKTTVTESDPVNLLANPKAIPGAVVLNVITAVNTGPGPADADALAMTDPIPANTAVFVGDFAGAGSGPVAFADGVTPGGMSYTYGGLADPADDLEFSSDGGATWNYVPVPDVLGFDPVVTHMRVVPKGAFAASDGVNHPGFSVSFKTRVE